MNSWKSLVLLSLVLITCTKQPHQEITVAAYKGDVAALIYIAEEMGYYREQGLDVHILNFSTGRDAMAFMAEGGADVATGADYPFVIQSFSYPDLRIIGTISTESQINFLMAHPKYTQPYQLEGKEIAVPRGTATEFLVEEYLAFEGINASIVNMPAPYIPQAVIDGIVEAGASWEPYISAVQGNRTIWPINVNREKYFLLVAHDAWLRDDKANKLLRALLDAEQYITMNPEESAVMVREKFGYSEEYMEKVWPQIDHTVFLGQSMLTILEDEARFALSHDIVGGQMPNYLSKIHVEDLKEVEPSRVTIIHET